MCKPVFLTLLPALSSVAHSVWSCFYTTLFKHSLAFKLVSSLTGLVERSSWMYCFSKTKKLSVMVDKLKLVLPQCSRLYNMIVNVS